MSEYRPGVTSPHTLSQRGLPLPPFSFQPPSDIPRLRAPPRPLPPHPTRSSTPTTSQRTSNVALLYRSLTPLLPACSLDFSLSRPALLSTSSSSLIILVLPVCVVLLVLRLRFFPLVVHSRGPLLDSSFFAIPSCPPNISAVFRQSRSRLFARTKLRTITPLSTCLVFLSGCSLNRWRSSFCTFSFLRLSTLLLSSYYLFFHFPHFS